MKAVIFDFDGVLVDTPDLLIRTEMDYFKSHGIEFTYSDFKQNYMPLPSAVSFKKVSDLYFAKTGKHLTDTHQKEMHDRLEQKFFTDIKLCDSAVELLQALNVPKAIATNSNQYQIDKKIDFVDLKSYFTPHIYCTAHVEKPKPAPDLYLYASEQLGQATKDCLVIEDSVTGTQAAIAAGATVLGYIGASHADKEDGERLKAAGAKDIIDNLEDILKYV